MYTKRNDSDKVGGSRGKKSSYIMSIKYVSIFTTTHAWTIFFSKTYFA